MVPPAPGLLSTMTDWPSSACSGAATRRATMSEEPPGEKVTITRTGFVGQVCAVEFVTMKRRVRRIHFMSAPSIGRIAPGRAQQRHMVMRARVGDHKTHRHQIQKALRLEIAAEMKRELVGARAQGVAFEKR